MGRKPKSKTRDFPMKDRQGPPKVEATAGGGVKMTLDLGDSFSRGIYTSMINNIGEKATWAAIESAIHANAIASPLKVPPERLKEQLQYYENKAQEEIKANPEDREKIVAKYQPDVDALDEPYIRTFNEEFRREFQRRALMEGLEPIPDKQLQIVAAFASMLEKYFQANILALRPQSNN